MVHRPDRQCYEFMREQLLAEADMLYDEAPRAKDWKAVQGDLDVSFPDADDIKHENWSAWHQALLDQLMLASKLQIAVYYEARFPECSVCGWSRS